MNKNRLQKVIDKHGIENIMFIFPMKPIRNILFISYKSSEDKETIVPCKINESRYKISDGYKITLECIYPGFGKEHLYQTDLMALIEQNIAQIFVNVSLTM